MDARIGLLRRVTIFEGLDDAALEQINACLKPVRHPKDSLIVNQDETGDSLFIINSGRVKVALTGEGGREMILSIFKPGNFFGEMSLLDGQPRSANVTAIEDAELLVLSRADFIRQLEARPSTALKILAEMSLRLRHADEIIGNLALLDVYGRVARVLMELAQAEGVSVDEGVLIRERPTQQDLASMSGTSRETVSRVLSELQRRGYLSMQGKAIVLGHGFADAALSQHALRQEG